MSLRMVVTQEQKPRLMQAFRALMLIAHAARGLITCRLLLDAEDSNALYYEEDWRTTEDFHQQARSTEYTRLLTLMEEAAEPPEFHLRWVTDEGGLEYLEKLRLDRSNGNADRATASG